MVICCVKSCSSRSDRKKNVSQIDGSKITFHGFPLKVEMRNRWIAAINCYESNVLKSETVINPVRRPFVCSLHFHDCDFRENLKVRRLHPHAVPNLFTQSKPPTKKENTVAENMRYIIKAANDMTGVTGNGSNVLSTSSKNKLPEFVLFQCRGTSNPAEENGDIENSFIYKTLLLNLADVEKPNQFWGITPTEKFTIFSRWNEQYETEKRIVIESTMNIKVFFGKLEIDVMGLMQIKSCEDISDLLERVESINLLEKEQQTNHFS